MEPQITLYTLLEVTAAADTNEIRESYRRLVAKYHPSVPYTGDLEKFNEITEAWKILSDSNTRAAYDKTIRAEA